MKKKSLFKEFLMCPECGNAIIDKRSLEDNIEEYKDSFFCTKCGKI